MKWRWIGAGVLATVIVAVLFSGAMMAYSRWSHWGTVRYGMHDDMYGRSTYSNQDCARGRTNYAMPGYRQPQMGYGNGVCPLADDWSNATGLEIEDVEHAVNDYVLRYDEHLVLAEIMEFERNFYAIVMEEDTGVGAMELLVDKSTGAIGPEMGPNMMWNTEYGMHTRGGMMSVPAGDPVYDENAMLNIAQEWLDERKPGTTIADHGDLFYGYMTVHTLEGDEITGMLSVNATSGDVWYHTWHGDYIAMESYTQDDAHD